MSNDEPEHPTSLLDTLVERGIEILGKLGWNAPRLRWKWNNFRGRMREKRLDASIRMRGVTAKHRMCPHCRALLPTGARVCSECGESLAGASKPGPARLLQWVMPGISPVSAAIVTANFAVFLLMGLRAGFAVPEGGGGLFGSLFGLMSFDGDTLIRYGSGSNFLLIYRGEWWRLICPIFLHGGLVHLLFNIYIFVQIAPLLEEEYGKDKFFVLYMSAGILSFVASELVRAYIFGRGVNTVGASGAIFGLVGAALVFGYRRGGRYGVALRSLMIRWTLYFLILGFLFPATDNFAHIGGLVAGAGFAMLVPAGSSQDRGAAALWRTASFAVLALAVVALLFAGTQGLESLEWFRSVR
jgi:rhomboid protease GluP